MPGVMKIRRKRNGANIRRSCKAMQLAANQNNGSGNGQLSKEMTDSAITKAVESVMAAEISCKCGVMKANQLSAMKAYIGGKYL